MKKIIALVLALTMLAFCVTGCRPKDKTEKTLTSNAPVLNYLYNTSAGHKAIGEYLQSALKTYGITMNLENQEWNTFLNTRKNGEYYVARNGWLADYNDPISFLDMWTSNSGNNDVQFGKGAHKDLAMYSVDLTPYGGDKIVNGTWAQTYDVLISKIKATTDNTQRYALMHLAEDLLMDTGCIVPLYFYTDLYMIDDQVQGFYSNPLGYKYFQKTTFGNKTELNVCIASEPDKLDPALNSAVDGATVDAHLFSGLTKWDKNADGKLVIVADSVESLVAGVTDPATGKVTYTYTLRQGLKWSDGVDVKASDFVYAWNRAASAELGADYGYMFEIVDGYADVADGVAGAKLNVVADDTARTITVTLANAVSYWEELLAFPSYYPVRKDVVEGDYGQVDAEDDEGNAIKVAKSWAAEASTFVGNGPYKMTSWDHDSKIVLEKNSYYIDADSVTMNKLNFFLSDDANNMLANFKKGDWQLIDDVPTEEIETLKKDYPTEFVVAGQIGTYYVCFNINKSLLPAGNTLTGVEAEKANAEIRKALALLFDRNYIVNDIAQGGQVPASSFVAMGMTDADGSQFYKNANGGKGGYYDVSASAFEANSKAALEILKKYYTFEEK